jgi:hypothetical protein
MRFRIALTAALVVAVLAATYVATAEAKTITIKGKITAMGISMTKSDGSPLGKLKPGKYKIKVTDKTSAHNFHLTGPNNVNKKTSISGTGTVTWTVTLKAGTYRFKCDSAPDFMKGSFKVKKPS